MLDVLGRHGVSPEQAKGIFDFYESQFKNNDELSRMDQVAQKTGGLNFNVRDDPNQAMQSGMYAQAYGLKPESMMPFAYPNYESGHFDAGDREVQYGFDPVNGKFINQNEAYGLNPTKKYQSDEDTKQSGISAGAQRYVADRNYAGKQLSASGEKPAKPLSVNDKKNLEEMVTKAIQISPDAQTLQMYLDRIAGDNPEMREYVYSFSSMPNFTKNIAGVQTVASNPYAGWYTPNQPQPEPQLKDFTPQAQKILESTNGDVKAAIKLIEASGVSPEIKESVKVLIRQMGIKK
ncbi:MAG: hypothetical protein AB7C92_02970 [Synergistaceae bacterium]